MEYWARIRFELYSLTPNIYTNNSTPNYEVNDVNTIRPLNMLQRGLELVKALYQKGFHVIHRQEQLNRQHYSFLIKEMSKSLAFSFANINRIHLITVGMGKYATRQKLPTTKTAAACWVSSLCTFLDAVYCRWMLIFWKRLTRKENATFIQYSPPFQWRLFDIPRFSVSG